MTPRHPDRKVSCVMTTSLREPTGRGSLAIPTHLHFCYRAHDTVFQPHAAGFPQASCSWFGETAAVGRDSPIVLPCEKCCLAGYWKAGRTEKLTQVTKSDWTGHFFISISTFSCGEDKTSHCLDLML